jgi:SET domain-containing protein
MNYQIQPCPYGNGLFATEPIHTGQVIGEFAGYETDYPSLTADLKRLVIYLGHGRAFVITNDLVYANHSCDPNCGIENDALIALREIAVGEQLTYSYNVFPAARFNPADDWWWDEDWWSFDCACGSPGCQGRIDSYRFV